MAICRGRDRDRIGFEDTRSIRDRDTSHESLTDEPHTLDRGTRIGEAHVITKCDRVEGMLSMTSQDPDDSEDSNVEGWLRDGCVKYRPMPPYRDVPRFDPIESTCVWIMLTCQSTCSP